MDASNRYYDEMERMIEALEGLAKHVGALSDLLALVGEKCEGTGLDRLLLSYAETDLGHGADVIEAAKSQLEALIGRE